MCLQCLTNVYSIGDRMQCYHHHLITGNYRWCNVRYVLQLQYIVWRYSFHRILLLINLSLPCVTHPIQLDPGSSAFDLYCNLGARKQWAGRKLAWTAIARFSPVCVVIFTIDDVAARRIPLRHKKPTSDWTHLILATSWQKVHISAFVYRSWQSLVWSVLLCVGHWTIIGMAMDIYMLM